MSDIRIRVEPVRDAYAALEMLTWRGSFAAVSCCAPLAEPATDRTLRVEFDSRPGTVSAQRSFTSRIKTRKGPRKLFSAR